MTAHVHAENMALYAQDAQETDTPWKRWEIKYPYENDSAWVLLPGNPIWDERLQYRRKPKTIKINGFDVPEPCRHPLKDGELFYLPPIFSFSGELVAFEWRNSWPDRMRHLNSGLVHLTKEAAEIHAKALMSFTAKGSKS